MGREFFNPAKDALTAAKPILMRNDRRSGFAKAQPHLRAISAFAIVPDPHDDNLGPLRIVDKADDVAGAAERHAQIAQASHAGGVSAVGKNRQRVDGADDVIDGTPRGVDALAGKKCPQPLQVGNSRA